MACLDTNNKEVQKWIKNVGLNETYKQFVIHNYALPNFDIYSKEDVHRGMLRPEYEKILSSLLDSDLFPKEELVKLRTLAPDALAAFWKGTLYFAEKATKLEVAEEAFHAIFQTLTTDKERGELLLVGERLFNNKVKANNLNTEQLFKKFQDETGLTGKALSDYVHEEELAKHFVNSFNYQGQLVNEATVREQWKDMDQSFVDKLITLFNKILEKLKSLVNKVTGKKALLESYFGRINRGQFKSANRITENYHTYPSLSVLYTEDGVWNVLDQKSFYDQMIYLIDHLNNNNLLTNFTRSELIEKALDIYQEHLNLKDSLSVNDNYIIDHLNPVLNGRKIIAKDLLEKVNAIFDIKEQYEENSEESENVRQEERNDTRSDENIMVNHYTSMGKKVKQLISTIPVKTSDPETIQGSLFNEFTSDTANVPLYRMADPKKIYSAMVRVTTNTSSPMEKIKKIILFSEDSKVNEDTHAFINWLLTKTFALDLVNNPEGLEEIKENIKDSVDVTDRIVDKRTLKSVLKAFDLYTRHSKISQITIDGKNKTFIDIDPHLTNVVENQLDKWDKNFRKQTEEQFKAKLGEFKKIKGSEILFQAKLDNTNLDEHADNVQSLYSFYGAELSRKYVEFITIRHILEKGLAKREDLNNYPLGPKYLNLYDSFSLKTNEAPLIDVEAGESDFKSLTNVKVDEKDEQGNYTFDPYFDDYASVASDTGVVERMKRVARGNVFFNETLLATSFLDAKNKTRYAHQFKTFLLEFLGNTTIDDKARQKHVSQLIKNQETEEHFLDGSNRYLNFLDKIEQKNRGKVSFSSYAGLNRKENNKTKSVINDIDAVDFAVLQANKVSQGQFFKNGNETIVTTETFMGSPETSKSLTFFTAPWTSAEQLEPGLYGNLVTIKDNKAGTLAIRIANSIIAQQTNRIVDEFNRFRNLLDVIPAEDSFSVNFTADKIRELGAGKGFQKVIQDFQTGVVHFKKDNDIVVLDVEKQIKEKKGPRGLTITTALTGYFGEDVRKDIIEQGFLDTKDEQVQDKINESIKESLSSQLEKFNKQVDSRAVFLSDFYKGVGNQDLFTKLGFLKASENLTEKQAVAHNVSLFYLNSMFNREFFHRTLMGDSAVIAKNDFSDAIKRFKGAEGIQQSIETMFDDKNRGVEAVIELKVLSEVSIEKKDYASQDASQFGNNTSGNTGKRIDQNDGQSIGSAMFKRKYLHGSDVLTDDTTRVLDIIENGTELTPAQKKWISESGIELTVDKTRGFWAQDDMKHGVYYLYKRNTSIKTKVDITLGQFNSQAKIVPTLFEKGKPTSYFTKPINDATVEYTAEFDIKKYSNIKDASLAGEVTYYEWTPQSDYQHERRKLLEGWRQTINGWTYNEDQVLDMVVPDSVLKRRKVNIWNGDVSKLDAGFITKLPASGYGKQEHTSSKKSITDPSQQMEIITSHLTGEIRFKDGNNAIQTLKVKDAVNKYQELLAGRTVTQFKQAVKELTNSEGDVNLKYLYENIIEGILTTGEDLQLIDGFSLYPDGTPKVNGNIPLFEKKLTQYFYAHFSKGVTVQKHKGDAKVMVAPAGFTGLKQLIKDDKGNISWKYIPKYTSNYNELFKLAENNRFENANLTFNGLSTDSKNNTLVTSLFQLENGSYFTDELRMNVPVMRNGQVQYFAETISNKWTHKQKDIQDSFRYSNGVRIPSQNKSTSVNIMLVDFFEQYEGNTIVVPKEYQELSGADYDIDKIYTAYLEGYWKGDEYILYTNKFNDYLEFQFKENKFFKKRLKERLALPGVKSKLDLVDEKLQDTKSAKQEAINTIKLYKENSEYFGLVKKASSDSKDAYKFQQQLEDIDFITSFVAESFGEKNIDEEVVETALFANKYDRILELIYNEQNVRDNKKENIKQLQLLERQKQDIVNAEKYVILAQFKAPSNELEFDNKVKSENFSYLAVYNNQITDMRLSMLTSDKAAYSSPTSVDPLKNLDEDSPLGIFKNENGESRITFSEASLVPYNSPLYDIAYRTKTDVAQYGISSAVNNSMVGLLLTRGDVNLHKEYSFDIDFNPRPTTEAKEGDVVILDTKGKKVDVKENKVDISGFKEKVTYTTNEGEVTFDVSDFTSVLTSVTTDEAKEGVLAKYNITAELLDVFAVGETLGIHPEILITALNNPIVQAISKSIKRNSLEKFEEVSIHSEIKKELGKEDLEPRTIYKQDFIDSLEGKLNAQGKSNVLWMVYNLSLVAQHNKETVKLLKIKQGFGTTYGDFERLLQAAEYVGLKELIVPKSDKLAVRGKEEIQERSYLPMRELEVVNTYSLDSNKKNKAMAAFFSGIQNIIPEMHDISSKVLIEANKNFLAMSNKVKRNFKYDDFNKDKFVAEIKNALLGTFIQNDLFNGAPEDNKYTDRNSFVLNPSLKQVIGDNSIAQRIVKLLRSDTKGLVSKSPLFSMINTEFGYERAKKRKSKKVDTMFIDKLSLSLFSKIDAETQSALMDSFVQLTSPQEYELLENNKQLSQADIDIILEAKAITYDLFNYFAGVSALAYSPGGISKIFDIGMFEKISKQYDTFLSNKYSDSAAIITAIDVQAKLATDIRNVEYIHSLGSTKTIGKDKKEYTMGFSEGTTPAFAVNKTSTEFTNLTKIPDVLRMKTEDSISAPTFVWMKGHTELGNEVVKDGKAIKYFTTFYFKYPLLGTTGFINATSNEAYTLDGEQLATFKQELREAMEDKKNAKELREAMQKHLNVLNNINVLNYVNPFKKEKKKDEPLFREDEFSDAEVVQEPVQSNLKTGVQDLFNEIPELANIGTQQEYSHYLNQIFSDSKVKDIVYHGTKKEKFDNVDISKSEWGGASFYITTDKNYAKSYATKNGNVIPIIINSKHIKRTQDAYAAQPYNKEILQKELDNINSNKIKLFYNGEGGLEIRILDDKKKAEKFIEKNSGWEIADKNDLKDYKNQLEKELKETPYDTILTNVEGGGDIILAVFKPEQLHILGNKQDIEQFKKYKESNTVNTNNNQNVKGEEIEMVEDFYSKTQKSFKKPMVAVKTDFKSGISKQANGNFLVKAYRTEDSGRGSKGFGQRGEGLYLSLTNPYPGDIVYSIEFEISPKEILTYKQDKYPDTIPYERLSSGYKGSFDEAVQSQGGKAFIGGINGSKDINEEIVIYDKSLIEQIQQSKKKIADYTTMYKLYNNPQNVTNNQTTQVQEDVSQFVSTDKFFTKPATKADADSNEKKIRLIQSSKKENYISKTLNGRNILKSGYLITIPSLPNVKLYITQESASQDSTSDTTEFNIKYKGWSIEIEHPTKGFIIIPSLNRNVSNLKDTIKEVEENINKQLQTENGSRVLKEVGIELQNVQQSIQVDQNIINDINTWTTVVGLQIAWEKLSKDKQVIYKEYFTKRKLEIVTLLKNGATRNKNC